MSKVRSPEKSPRSLRIKLQESLELMKYSGGFLLLSIMILIFGGSYVELSCFRTQMGTSQGFCNVTSSHLLDSFIALFLPSVKEIYGTKVTKLPIDTIQSATYEQISSSDANETTESARYRLVIISKPGNSYYSIYSDGDYKSVRQDVDHINIFIQNQNESSLLVAQDKRVGSLTFSVASLVGSLAFFIQALRQLLRQK
jgi:hypothetical protein